MFRLEQRAKNEIVDRFTRKYCAVHEGQRYSEEEAKKALYRAIQNLKYSDDEFVKAVLNKLSTKYQDKEFLEFIEK